MPTEQEPIFVTFSNTTSHLHRQNLLNAAQLYDSKTESDRLSSPIEVLRNSLKMRIFWRKFQTFFIVYFAKSRYIKCSYPSFSSLTEKKEIICVLFFPLQIRIYFEFLSNIKYKLYSFEANLKTRKYGINPLVDCFHASYLPILMEIRTEVLIPKIAYSL